MTQTLRVQASKPYGVLIGTGLLDEAGALIAGHCPCGSVALLTDEKVDRLYAEQVMESLARAGIRAVRYVFPGGERHKSMETVSKILSFLVSSGITRADCVAALGGGIVGDVAGFCAAIHLRGVRFVQIPTTFLAAVDSSVGGKTAVNLPEGKNLAGAFWQPSLVICDCDTFRTLPAHVFADGTAETLKHGVISDSELFYKVAKKGFEADIVDVVSRSVQIKIRVVESDELETGQRQLLNFGHTAGHAIELCTDFAVSHGHAVGIGMLVAARAAKAMGFSSEDCETPIRQALVRHGLPTQTDCPKEALLKAMMGDKKRADSKITLVLPQKIGHCALRKMPVTELSRFLDGGLQGGNA